jgi:hypothetical protein
VVAQPLRRAETLALFLVLVWPLCGSGGDGGSRVPLAFGWEVPVSVPRLASRSDAEQERRAGATRSADVIRGRTKGQRYDSQTGRIECSWIV